MAAEMIMLVEQDADTRSLLASMLRQVDHAIVKALPDEEALLHAVTLVRPDLLVLDADGPGMDGRETYHRLRRHRWLRRTPMLLVTSTPEQLCNAELPGPHACVGKPCLGKEVLTRIAALLGKCGRGSFPPRLTTHGALQPNVLQSLQAGPSGLPHPPSPAPAPAGE